MIYFYLVFKNFPLELYNIYIFCQGCRYLYNNVTPEDEFLLFKKIYYLTEGHARHRRTYRQYNFNVQI